ncbi:MAG: Holliday junction resolvase RuvX [Aquificaceae bacterium]|nr:Holliday junction resolvase RuvX [Aquificaceae bacterium]MCX8060139.1 Holliday junction resolvase RuvX [Aquificaceae bacterium]MDW8096906.1 Holliday junction resolvase RuvX [Aquificaceae bacterium]
MKILALDYGSRRIGLALGDSRLGLATPVGSLENRGEATLQSIVEKVKEHGVSLVLVGLPLTPTGREGQRASEVKEFFSRLRELMPQEVDMLLWDERDTTQEAYRLLQGHRKKRELKDSLSAYVLLLEYLESL